MKINILVCDTFPGLLPEYIPSYPSMFTSLFDKQGKETEYKMYMTMEGELPETIDPEAIYIVPGSNDGVYDDKPWIRDLLGWIRQANDSHAKILGVCFGHQAIAQALGGRVEKASVGWGIGARKSKISGSEALCHFPNGEMCLLYNHHDQVKEPPRGAFVFASSPFCPIDGFMMGENILTFQGHPEYMSSYPVHLLMNFAEKEPKEVRIAALKSIGAMSQQGDEVARWVLEKWGKTSDK